MSTNSTERSVMSASAEAASLLRQVAGSGEPGELKKAAWGRAYRRLSGAFTFNRVKDLWRCEPRARVSADELEILRRKAGEQSGAKDELGERIARLEAWAARSDPQFYSAHVAALRDLAGRGRREN